MSHPPPVPPDQQSDKVYGEHSTPQKSPEVARDPAAGVRGGDQQGDAGDRAQNVPHIRQSGDR